MTSSLKRADGQLNLLVSEMKRSRLVTASNYFFLKEIYLACVQINRRKWTSAISIRWFESCVKCKQFNDILSFRSQQSEVSETKDLRFLSRPITETAIKLFAVKLKPKQIEFLTEKWLTMRLRGAWLENFTKIYGSAHEGWSQFVIITARFVIWLLPSNVAWQQIISLQQRFSELPSNF